MKKIMSALISKSSSMLFSYVYAQHHHRTLRKANEASTLMRF